MVNRTMKEYLWKCVLSNMDSREAQIIIDDCKFFATFTLD